MKLIYKWDSQSIFSGTKLVEDDYQPQAGETFSAIPQPNLMPVKWTGSAWQSATQEEHDAYVAEQRKLHPDWYPEQKPVGPSAEQQMIATLGQQQAKTDANVKQMQQMIAMLGSQMASSDTKEKANGGN